MWKEFLTKARNGDHGQDLAEYSLLLTLIGVISLLMLTAVGINVGRVF